MGLFDGWGDPWAKLTDWSWVGVGDSAAAHFADHLAPTESPVVHFYRAGAFDFLPESPIQHVVVKPVLDNVVKPLAEVGKWALIAGAAFLAIEASK